MKKPQRDRTEADAPLHDPPELSRLIAGRLPRLSQELMVVCVGAALYYKLRLIGALGVGSIEAERGDDDQIATDFDAKFGDPDQACLNATTNRAPTEPTPIFLRASRALTEADALCSCCWQHYIGLQTTAKSASACSREM